MPLLLQMFVWYGAVLKPLPGPKEAINIGDMFFLSNRGLNMPNTIYGEGAWLGLAGLVAWHRRRHCPCAAGRASGRRQPGSLSLISSTGIAMVLALPVLGLLLAGWPITFDYPVLWRLQLQRRHDHHSGIHGAALALSIYTGSFIAEIVRAGIQSVSHGQTEAASALGLRNMITTRLVIIPQAMRVIIPPLASQYLNLTKNSSLAVAIGYPDLVATGGTVLNQTGQAVEIVMIWMVVYLSLSLLTSGFMNWYNARMKLVER